LKEKVALVEAEGPHIEAAVRRAVSLAGGLDGIIKPGSRVLVKPNLFRPEPSGRGLTTDCRVTEAVARMALEMGAGSVVIGEGAGAGYDFDGSHSTEEAFRISGTTEVACRLGVELCNLNRDAFVEVPIASPYVMDSARIARTALESDVIISVPLLKTHLRTMVTLSLKNMKGVLAGAEKRKAHRLGLDQAIADLNSVVKPSYVIVDGLAGMQGRWEYPDDRFELGLVIAARDPVAADTACTHLMGFDPGQIMHLQYFARRQGTTAELEQLELVGAPMAQYRLHLKSGFEVVKCRYPGVTIVEGEATCTGCTGELIGALSAVREAGFGAGLQDLTVLLGNCTEVGTAGKTLVLGKCARKLARMGLYVRGCPPRDDDMVRAMGQVCGIDAVRVLASREAARERIWEETRALLER
jgi:uncharacterized protein (DUF362 family)